MKIKRLFLPSVLRWILIAVLASAQVGAAELRQSWVGTWATSPRAEDPAAAGGLALEDGTLRQVVHGSIGGSRVRLRLSNAFGTSALSLHGVHLASASADGAIRAGTDRPLLFSGQPSATIPAGASMLSDPLDFELPAMGDVAISIHFKSVPATLTTHPGSRTTSYLLAGDQLAALELPAATKAVRWFFIQGLDVVDGSGQAGALVVLGDSITDGYGCTTDRNNRWTDDLARRLQANPATSRVGVLNAGIGGNRILRDGAGPNALARFDRDVIAHAGVRWLIVLEGINDIGTRVSAQAKGESFASAADIIAAYEQMIERAHTHGIRVIGATILPFGGNKGYWNAEGEADRQAVNTWIRTSGRFDAVIDFDAALRLPEQPERLKPGLDCGDHLHPSLAGYAEMARVVDLALFKN
ncbi:MAG TPA: SGNH/GDSL hydrolase family protein [Opitutaceae bacterium]|nr:SGNH/GDSL hydrolase family protein [Opitutaceae bacterium]